MIKEEPRMDVPKIEQGCQKANLLRDKECMETLTPLFLLQKQELGDVCKNVRDLCESLIANLE